MKLTPTHAKLWGIEGFHAIGKGRPAVLANLTTLLETGDVLPQAP